MDALLANVAQLRSSMSSSDISHSSGASGNASTRETSPDSLLDTALASHVEQFAAKRADEMDRNPFQSVNERRARHVFDRVPAQPQVRSGVTSPVTPRSNGIASANWR